MFGSVCFEAKRERLSKIRRAASVVVCVILFGSGAGAIEETLLLDLVQKGSGALGAGAHSFWIWCRSDCGDGGKEDDDHDSFDLEQGWGWLPGARGRGVPRS